MKMEWKQDGRLIYDSYREVMICELSKPGVNDIHHEPVGLDSPSWEHAMMHGRLITALPDLLEALKPFAHLVEVMPEGAVLNFRGVYVTQEQAQAAADAITKATSRE